MQYLTFSNEQIQIILPRFIISCLGLLNKYFNNKKIINNSEFHNSFQLLLALISRSLRTLKQYIQNIRIQILQQLQHHTMQISKYLDPFSIPTQLNNFCVLIVAYAAKSANADTNCHDARLEPYLYFILYGSTLVCTGTFVLSILYGLGVIDYCINKVCPFGQVCLTLNTLGIFLIGIIYHCIATVYGLMILVGEAKSECIQLEMFKKITGIIYAIWILGIVLFVIFICLRSKLRNKYSDLNERFIKA